MSDTKAIADVIAAAQKILIIQADNPDADSLASALALEQILHAQGKEPYMYCGIDMPAYLKYLPGWDRVTKDVPPQFDASIIVDTSAQSLLGNLQLSGHQGWVASHPVIVLDHHAGVPCDIPYATNILNDSSNVSTGELIYHLALEFGWELPLAAQEFIMTSILADSMGLTTEGTTPETYRVMAALAENGVDRPKLEELRRASNKMPLSILRYKARLIECTEFLDDNHLAIVVIPQPEITEFSPLYNPGPLVQGDLLQTKGVAMSVVLKSYDSGRVTGTIRCNINAPVAAELAEHFGGGGHKYAAGFKLEGGRPINEIKSECTKVAIELLSKHDLDKDNETIQYTF